MIRSWISKRSILMIWKKGTSIWKMRMRSLSLQIRRISRDMKGNSTTSNNKCKSWLKSRESLEMRKLLSMFKRFRMPTWANLTWIKAWIVKWIAVRKTETTTPRTPSAKKCPTTLTSPTCILPRAFSISRRSTWLTVVRVQAPRTSARSSKSINRGAGVIPVAVSIAMLPVILSRKFKRTMIIITILDLFWRAPCPSMWCMLIWSIMMSWTTT